jgi:hypothetical protein
MSMHRKLFNKPEQNCCIDRDRKTIQRTAMKLEEFEVESMDIRQSKMLYK